MPGLTDSHAQTVEATVTAELPQRLFRLETTDGSLVTAGPSEEAKRLGVQIRTGQRVLVRTASLDPTQGVIVGLAVGPGQNKDNDEGKS